MLLENTTYPEDVRVRKEANTLASAGYDVAIIVSGRKGQQAVEKLDGVRVHRFPAAFAKDSRASSFFVEYAWASLWLTLLSWWVWLRHGFDAIHLHNPPDTLFAVAMPFRLFGKAIVYDNHDLTPELIEVKFHSRLLRRVFQVLEGLSCSWSDAVITTSEIKKEVLVTRHNISSKKITVVRNGPSRGELDVIELRQPGCRDLDVRFGFIGAVDPQDGVELIIDSLHSFKRSQPGLRFSCRIIGDGIGLDGVRERTHALGLEREVEFCDFLPWPEAMQALSECDICVDAPPLNPYHRSNEAVKVLEYMAQGKPMVLTDSPGHRAAASDAALYAESQNPDAFAARLIELVDNPELARRLGQTGRARFESTFCWEIMGSRLVSVYHGLQGRRDG
jgi:glycosyltransferase involved in cell wall biosynthesis